MTHRDYKRPMRFISRNYANVMATLALVVALTGTAAVASGVIVTSKQIKNGSILTQDIHKNAVRASDIGSNSVSTSEIKDDAVAASDIGAGQVDSEAIGTGQVTSSEIGNGQVTPQDVDMPEPQELEAKGAASKSWIFGEPQVANFELVDPVGAYEKTDAGSVLQVDWIGTAAGNGCVFQLRVDGQPVSGSGGEVFASAATSVAASALFPGLGVGSHQIEIWARPRVPSPSAGGTCTVGPEAAGIDQTFIISEQIL